MQLVRRHTLLFQALLTGVFVAVLAWRIDIHEAAEHVLALRIPWALAAMVAFIAMHCLAALRWKVIVGSDRDAPFRTLLLVYLVSRLANVLVPTRGGDVVRVQVAARRSGISRSELAATVAAVETPVNLASLGLVLSVALVFLDVPVISGPVAAVLTLTVLTLIGLLVRLARHGMPEGADARPPLRWLPRTARKPTSRILARFVDGMQSIRRVRTLGLIFGMTLLFLLVQAVVYGCLGQAFGLDIAWPLYVVVGLGPNLVRLLPLTPGDIGPFEVVLAELARWFGAGAGAAGAFAVGSHLLIIAWTGLMGLAASWMLGLGTRDIFRIRS